MRQRSEWDPVDGVVLLPPYHLQQPIELMGVLEIAIRLAGLRAVHDYVFGAQILELSNCVLPLALGGAVHAGADLVAEVQRHAGSQAGFEASIHLVNFVPRIQPEAKTAGGEHAATGVQCGQPFRYTALDCTFRRQRPSAGETLRAIRPKLSPTG